MPGVKNRKGDIQKTKVVSCSDCGQVRKGVIFMKGKKKSAFMCDCGVFNKVGVKIHSF